MQHNRYLTYYRSKHNQKSSQLTQITIKITYEYNLNVKKKLKILTNKVLCGTKKIF